jgi:AraC-like DNA-binding protein
VSQRLSRSLHCFRDHAEVIAIHTAHRHLCRPARRHVTVADRFGAEQFLENAYDSRMRLHHRGAPPDGGPVLRHSRIAFGPVAIDEIDMVGDISASPNAMEKVVAVLVAGGRVSIQSQGIATAAAGDVALLCGPAWPHRWRATDLRATTVLLDSTVLAEVAAGVGSGHPSTPLQFTGFEPVDAAASRLWTDTVTYLANTVLAEGAVVTPMVIDQAGRLLAAVTLSTFPNTAAGPGNGSQRADGMPIQLRRAVEFIDANVTNDITVGDIAAAVHLTPRAVQYLFRHHMDTTPLQHLRRIRLQYAHLDLSATDRKDDTVTRIAARWGFDHTGRFAMLYRQTYGLSPHQTLRN